MHNHVIGILDMVFTIQICTSRYAFFCRFTIFKLLGQHSTFKVSKLPLSLQPLSHGLFFVTLKFCGSGTKSFTALNTNFLCVFEHLRFQL
jgi:hypothetical protein